MALNMVKYMRTGIKVSDEGNIGKLNNDVTVKARHS